MDGLDEDVVILAGALKDTIEGMHGTKVGFALFLFDYGANGRIAYASTASREHFIATLEDFLAQIKRVS